MSIVKLTTSNFRNLQNGTIDFHPNLNFFIGKNGSGKSSLLESIFYLGHGKSFRTTKLENLVNFDHSNYVVSVLNSNQKRFGILRDIEQGLVEIKIDGVKHNKLSELAQNIAAQIITPESFKLFFGGPKERRRFIDLGMFHVEHSFPDNWKNFTAILKQRNACLRMKLKDRQFDYWTDQFCLMSETIAIARRKYIELLKAELVTWLALLLPQYQNDISVEYLQGWNAKRELKEILIANEIQEFKKGFSLHGAQKFDVRFLYKGLAIETLLSRGQQKLFLLALTFAQSKLIEQVKRLKPILLIDDIGAELDENSRNAFYKAISQVNCQVNITAIDKLALEPIIPKNNNYKMFHVEHGKISAMSI